MLFRSRTAALNLIGVGALFLVSNLWLDSANRSSLASMVAHRAHHRGSLDAGPTIIMGQPPVASPWTVRLRVRFSASLPTRRSSAVT
jgi:hypothetical protein